MPVISMSIKNIVVRNGWYSFRITVPKELRKRVGLKNITKTLNTQDESEAKRLAEKLTERWKQTFEGMRGNTQVLTAGDVEEQIAVFRATLRKRLDDHLKVAFSDDTDESLSTGAGWIRDELSDIDRGNWHLVKCRGLLDGGQTLKAELESWQHVQRLVRRVVATVQGILLAYHAAIQEELGFIVDVPFNMEDVHYRSPFSSNPSNSTAVTNREQKPTETLAQVLKEMLDAKKRALRTVSGLESNTRVFMEFCGSKDVSEYTTADVLAFRDRCLARLPPHGSKKFEGSSLKELLAMGEDVERIGETTVNNRMRAIRTVFAYATRTRAHITIDPAANVGEYTAPKKKADSNTATPEEAVKVFTDDEIQIIIKGAVDSNYERFPARRWATLLIVNLGMRANECLQLRTCDIDIKAGTLDIVDKHDTQRLKNKTAQRYLPLPKVITKDKEFVAYVKKRQAVGKDIPLWENTTYTESNGYRRGWSRWFNKLEVVTGGRTAHGLRHTVITRGRKLKLPIEDVQRIVGHSTGGSLIHEGYTDRRELVESLRDTVEALAVSY